MEQLHIAFWVFCLRAAQTVMSAVPTLLAGLVLAWLAEVYLGPARIRSLFRGGPMTAAVRAWCLAVVFPTCSLGVLPCASVMRRAGVRDSAVIAFLFAGPAFNLWSLVYGATAMPPQKWWLIVACSLLVTVVSAAIIDRMFMIGAGRDAGVHMPQAGPEHQILVPGVGRSRSRRLWSHILIGVVGSALLAVILPAGSLEHWVCKDGSARILGFGAIMVPAWISPEWGVVLARDVLRIGSLPGAVVPIVLLGGGVSLATLSWLGGTYGTLRAAAAMALLVTMVCLAGIAADHMLARGPSATDETHAFDALTTPYHPARTITQGLEMLKFELLDRIGIRDVVGVLGLAAMAVLSLRSRRTEARTSLTADQEPATELSRTPARWQRPLSRRTIVATIGFCVGSAVGLALCTYYPKPSETLDDIWQLHSELFVAVRTHRTQDALKHIEDLDAMTRRLSIGVAIRGNVTAGSRAPIIVISGHVAALRQALIQDRPDEAGSQVLRLSRSILECRARFASGD